MDVSLGYELRTRTLGNATNVERQWSSSLPVRNRDDGRENGGRMRIWKQMAGWGVGLVEFF